MFQLSYYYKAGSIIIRKERSKISETGIQEDPLTFYLNQDEVSKTCCYS